MIIPYLKLFDIKWHGRFQLFSINIYTPQYISINVFR